MRTHFRIPLHVSLGLTLAGCQSHAVTRDNAAPVAAAWQAGPRDPEKTAPTPPGRGYEFNDITSHFFGIEATVVSMEKSSTQLRWIEVKTIKTLPTALGWEPYGPGDVFVVRIDETLTRFAQLPIGINRTVRFWFGQARSPDWVSNASWIQIERGGAFFNDAGRKMVDNDGFPRR